MARAGRGACSVVEGIKGFQKELTTPGRLAFLEVGRCEEGGGGGLRAGRPWFQPYLCHQLVHGTRPFLALGFLLLPE